MFDLKIDTLWQVNKLSLPAEKTFSKTSNQWCFILTGSESCITHDGFENSNLLFDNNITTCKTLESGTVIFDHVLYIKQNCTDTSEVRVLDYLFIHSQS